MWLRQVQKDPAQFLSRKFLMQSALQYEKQSEKLPAKSVSDKPLSSVSTSKNASGGANDE
jgi:hypothetical protein